MKKELEEMGRGGGVKLMVGYMKGDVVREVGEVLGVIRGGNLLGEVGKGGG